MGDRLKICPWVASRVGEVVLDLRILVYAVTELRNQVQLRNQEGMY